MGAERPISRCFLYVSANLGLKPLSPRVDQADQCYRGFTYSCCNFGYIIISLLWLSAQNPILC